MFEFDIPLDILRSHAPRGTNDPAGEYRKLARVMAERIITLVDFSNNPSVIDIGCGAGRVAMGLHEVLRKNFSYIGFDIRYRDILFARENITREILDYQFVHLDFFNDRYNNKGRITGTENYYFPALSGAFDIAIATSFFTHVDSAMAQKCLNEIFRTLKPGGTGFLTFFIMGNKGFKGENTNRKFVKEFEPGCWTGDPENVYQSVMFDSTLLQEMIAKAGLEIELTNPGLWRGRDIVEEFNPKMNANNNLKQLSSSQDIVVIKRPF